MTTKEPSWMKRWLKFEAKFNAYRHHVTDDEVIKRILEKSLANAQALRVDLKKQFPLRVVF